MPASKFERVPNGLILDFHGTNTVTSPDRIPQGKYVLGQNVRRYILGGTVSRHPQTAPLITIDSGGSIHSLRRMNDSTPAGPPSGYVLISGRTTILFANAIPIAPGLSGKKVSIVPFRPNQSVQPWAYVADDNTMLKVRSDGTCYNDGIAEPLTPATVVFAGGGGTVVPGINGIQYRCVYRSSATGALSNPGPASTAGTNTQSNATSTIQNADLNTKVTFNGVQWEFNSNQLRTTGSITDNAQVLDYVVAHNFGLSIPTGVDIDGIQIDLNWQNQSGFNAGALTNVSLFYNGNPIGAAKSPGTASQSLASDAIAGGAADTWGATLTPDQVNSASFGFGVQIFENKGRIFLNSFKITVYYSSQNASISAPASPDPQVDKIDYYRFGKGLENYTYVGTGPNGSSSPFVDTLDDLTAQENPVLETDNFQPYPSIDLPRSGVLSASGGVLTRVSGDTFNIRWLPGTDIVIAGIAYISDRRPASTSSWTIPGVADGTNVAWNIAAPPLAAQPMRSQWGPTDNVAYMFACGDTLRPGTLYFTKGNNPDSAPDTNQIEVTSPSEPLQNGCIVAGISLVFSTERAWLAQPNFFNALATVTGTIGSAFSMQLSINNRGLFARKGVCSDGQNAYFIGKDGVYVSPGGNGSKSLTDGDLYNLFPHEDAQAKPSNITIGVTGVTIYAPDFTNPDAMELSFSNGYVYFDYQDASGTNRTLVYGVQEGGWIIDAYQTVVTVHATEEGRVEGVLVGCTDGTIRELSAAGTETGTAQILLPSFNAGDARAQKRFGDAFLEAAIELTKSVTVALYDALYTVAVAGFTPVSLTAANQNRNPYVVDFASGLGLLAVDLGVSLSWPLSLVTTLYTWQPTLVPQPETTQNRPTEWDDGGYGGAKFVQGVIVKCNTAGVNKTFQIQSGDDSTFHTLNEVPANTSNQTEVAFSCDPFVAHTMRLVATDNVPWQLFDVRFVFQPYPELCTEWQSERISHGLKGWQHVYALNVPTISTAAVTLLLQFDQGPQSSVTVTVPSTAGQFTKQLVILPYNKFKLVSYKASSTAPFRLFLPQLEVLVKQWGSNEPYRIVRPFGGAASEGAEV